MRQLDVSVTIAHNKRAREAQAVLPGRLLQQSWQRLAAGAVVPTAVRTIVEAIDASPGSGQFLADAGVNLRHQRLRKNSPRNARLIGNHDYRQACLIQLADCRGGKRKHMQPAEMIEITHLFANGSIAIEENCRAQSLRFRQGVGSKRSSS